MPIPNDLPKLHRTSAKNQVLSLLQDWITDGTLQPGEKIIDAELAQTIGVSRTPIREALQILETQGFVEMKPGKETRITPLKPEDAHDIYLPLTSLEVLATELAAKQINEHKIQTLEKLNQDFIKAVHSQNPHSILEMDRRFHQMIIDTAKNPYISSFTHVLHLHIKRYELFYFEHAKGIIEESIKDHHEIIESFKSQDHERAKKYMQKNWTRAFHEVTSNLQNNVSSSK
ncbi:GntR family transcriptional regulator [Thermoflavimicrobium daqui]|uniref:GntR family transcriptional regulator n=1 Tax=Thermoflavimicrobium daqui TaxID=2137476 RepID=A0A364K666_9BACL|nr:GntR family transcriptional regulator [Thermoflavimicrobium daqui]RAL25777.1 GntR family transcriptional regulator [Thermoflavimicrobium daqui]